MKTILIIDDDVYIGDMLQELLIKENYRVLRAYSGSEALLVLKSNRPDLVLLDLMLPGLNGEKVLSKIQEIPVIVVSAKAEVEDKVSLLLSGAADYVTKPFDCKELLARIEVAFRKYQAADAAALLEFDNIKMDVNAHDVFIGDETVKLTRTEYAILKLLMQNPMQVIPKSTILEQISEDTPDCMENSLKVHISNLRKKMKKAGGKDYIEAVWGIGFKMQSS